MSIFRVKNGKAVEVFMRPDPATGTGIFLRDHNIVDVFEKKDKWAQVTVITLGFSPPEMRGWVPFEALEVHENAGLSKKIDREEFYLALRVASTGLTDPFFMFAVADLESGIENKPGVGVDPVSGPFQFKHSTWNGLIEKDFNDLGFAPADVFNWENQIDVAAKWFASLKAQLDKELKRPCRYNELYLVHLLGEPVGLKVASSPATSKVEDVIADKLDGPRASKVIEANPSVLSPGAAGAATLEEVLVRVARRFDGPLEEAAGYAAKQSSALVVAGDEPSWLRAARGQLGIKQGTPLQPSRPEVEKYFEAVGSGVRLPDDTDWCAAFVAWCLRETGDQAVLQSLAPVKKDGALAATWRRWGNHSADPVVGAVAVLNHHCGFVVDATTETVRLLGGNQKTVNGGRGVTISHRPKSEILEFRKIDF